MLQGQWNPDGIAPIEGDAQRIQPGWVRLRVAACGICGSDLHAYRGEFGARHGMVPGHEFVGSIVDGPKGLSDTLYAVEPRTSCGQCDFCVAGRRHLCKAGRLLGMNEPGGMSQQTNVPENRIYAVDPAVAAVPASMAEPLAVCVRAMHLARLDMNSRVLVLGAGTIGLLSGLLARDRCGQVAITARHRHQRETAERLGMTPLAEDAVAAWAREEEPDVVIETVGGEADTLEQAITLCRAGGRIVVLGAFTSRRSLDMLSLMSKELTLMGSVMYGTSERGAEFAAAVSLLPRYQAEIAGMQTHQFPLTSIKEAFETAGDKRTGAIKVTVLPN